MSSPQLPILFNYDFSRGISLKKFTFMRFLPLVLIGYTLNIKSDKIVNNQTVIEEWEYSHGAGAP
jgi:hypothetical protein